ncbi:MAG: hypothetical protein V5A88_03900 [Candidatus Thermoplasmatota archaeon]
MLDQKEEINKSDWDYLLILDACRYDYFEKFYDDFLSGQLKRASSPVDCTKGVATSEWCKAVFTRKYDDVIYVSTTPHVNSFSEVNGFKASEHFYKVVDVWNTRWDEEKGTVYPDEVNQAIIETMIEHPEKRVIAHYMQPHFPYLTLDNPFNPKNKDPSAHDNLKRSLRNFFGSRIRTTLGGSLTRKLLRIFNLPPINPMDETLRKVGHDGLIKAYEENLKAVLESLSKLSDELSGEVIVSADHGEYLGENGFYGHSYLPKHQALNDVPWFKMETL